jgi:N6-L-threonylcarbamoyladenine synthase
VNHSVVLGIETSCDETGAALIVGGKLVADRTTTQVLHEKYGGVVPELASRAHEQLLPAAVAGVLNDADVRITDLDAVASTYGPGLAGSLLVGVSFAKGVAAAAGKPWIAVNHLEAHIWSIMLTGVAPPLPFLALIVSGGHTLLVAVHNFGDYYRLGGTRDDAAGELFDKVGRLMGFPFPAGAVIDREASEFQDSPVEFPRARLADDPFSFSFSGLKTAVLYYLRNRYPQNGSRFDIPAPERAAISAGIMAAVADMLTDRVANACDAGDYRAILAAGGVAASRVIKKRLGDMAAQRGIPFLTPPPALCTDNGGMIGYIGWRRLATNQYHSLSIPVDPSAQLFSHQL